MEKTITKKESSSLATLRTPSDTKIAMVKFSVEVHRLNSPLDQAIYRLYPSLLLAGAGKYSRLELVDAIKNLGGSIDISVSEGLLHITLRGTAKNFARLLDLFVLVLTKPNFAAAEIKRVKTLAKNELILQEEDSRLQAAKGLKNLLYGERDPRYELSSKNLAKEIGSVKAGDLRAFHKRVLSGFWSVSVLGNRSNVSLLKQKIESLKKRYPLEKSAESVYEPLDTAGKLRLKSIQSRSNIDFSIGAPLPITLRDDDYIPLVFALSVLGTSGFAGRLMSTVREKEGLTYGIYSFPESFVKDRHGHYRIFTFFTPQNTLKALTSTFREVRKLYERGVPTKEFETFKVIFNTKQTLLRDSVLRQFADLHSFNVNGFDVAEMEEFKERLQTVTRKEVNDVIKKYLDPKRLSISSAGPVKGLEKEIARFLSRQAKQN